MRVLVTAGGTRAYLDEVRWMGNVSTGRFGSHIVEACLARGAEVHHLHARSAITPYRRIIDLAGNLPKQFSEMQAALGRLRNWQSRYHPVPFDDVWEYGAELERLLKEERVDVVFLAAAVSDYAPDSQEGKIRSGEEAYAMSLRRVPKFIEMVKDWAPEVYQVGFKLLAGSSQGDLLEVASRACRSNGSDVTVANDIRQLRRGEHWIHLVRIGEPTESFGPDDHPAERLVERVWRWSQEEAQR